MSNRKQELDKARAEEERRLKEQDQTLYKKPEGHTLFAISVGSTEPVGAMSDADMAKLQDLLSSMTPTKKRNKK